MRLISSRLSQIGILLILAFVPMSMFIGPLNLYLLLGSWLFAVSMAVVFTYWSILWFSLEMSEDDLHLTDILVMAIVLVFFAVGCREAYVTFYQTFFPLDGQKRSPDFYLPLAICRHIGIVAGLLALSARNTEARRGVLYYIPGWPRAIIATIVGLAIGVTLIQITL